MHSADNYSKHSWIIWPVWLNGLVFVYEQSGYGFKSSCSHLNFRFCTYFDQGVPWHSGNYRAWIHFETRTWHDKNVQSRVYLIGETKGKELMSKIYKKVCTALNYIEHFLILTSRITGCVSISSFASLFGISIWITSSEIGLKMCTITAAITKYKSVIKKKKHDKTVLLARSKLNSMEVLISKALIDSVIIHDEFFK